MVVVEWDDEVVDILAPAGSGGVVTAPTPLKPLADGGCLADVDCDTVIRA